MAAATEKFIRNHTTDMIHSEDLTASQFAYLTGIQTKRHPIESPMIESDSDSDSESELEEDHLYSASIMTHHSQQDIRIWDTRFWQYEPKQLTRHQSEPGVRPNVIQKGRFRIMWGSMDDDLTAHSQPAIRCIEWKRKRSQSQS
ncbi:hypothetical protein A0J61_03052 [Choanephora cucurbitarum]|uniref:Uncharacterized protein n=1 Tax=Choanephora cucurbitarum TaxID=101091 RepID=A0A1C7NIR9_9FUNG|nr:hypothetical protein A0J61_03052 [Choanephora cucurbitarum]